MNKKKTKKETEAKIVKSNSENYTFLSQNHIPSNSIQKKNQEAKTAKKIEKRHSSSNIKFHYRSKNIRTKQGHSPVYE